MRIDHDSARQDAEHARRDKLRRGFDFITERPASCSCAPLVAARVAGPSASFYRFWGTTSRWRECAQVEGRTRGEGFEANELSCDDDGAVGLPLRCNSWLCK